MAIMKATPWGKAVLVDEVVAPQQAPGRVFSTHVQLLETESGERLVRMAYSTAENGHVRRGPVTMPAEGLTKLLEELAGHPELAAAFGLTGEGAKPRRPSGHGLRRRESPG
jgi:hypothetical protein